MTKQKFVLFALALAGAAALAHPALAQKPAAPAAPAAPAPVSSDPETQTASYGDWTLRCQRNPQGAGPKRLCEVAQSVTIKGQQQPIAQIAFGRVTADEPLRMTVVIPNDVGFPSAVRVDVDEKDSQPAELAWTRCLPVGCFATAAPVADTLKRWRAGTGNGRLGVKTAEGKQVFIPFSFRGLAQALDALAAQK
ncbi:MAG: invasion associated locus B family protein [Hyphomicrobiales bacterium]|nr:invasion associated locus B family protein [Hyphomicrobiales bacterium]